MAQETVRILDPANIFYGFADPANTVDCGFIQYFGLDCGFCWLVSSDPGSYPRRHWKTPYLQRWKTSAEFDERLKEHVGLTFNLDIDYIKKNPKPNTDFLKENLITQAIVLASVTSLDNKCSMPCAVEYSAKSGKTAKSCQDMFKEQVKILQTCESCLKKSSSTKHILGKCYEQCQCFCQVCYDAKSVREECRESGQVSHHLALRACASCLSQNEACVKRAMFVVTADCETGNKSALR